MDIYISAEIRSLSKGNPGALSFLTEVCNLSTDASIKALDKIKESGIVGWGLYVLWSDICERDMNNVIKLLDDCPLPLLKDACSRQDYSGRKLVAKYLPSEEKK